MLAFVGLFALAFAGSAQSKAQHAWNGHTSSPSQLHPSIFLPYYVPPGAKGIDSSWPLVHYSGDWLESYSATYAHRTLKWTKDPSATASLTFTGTGIEWFGNTGRTSCISSVFIDGALVQTVNAYKDVRKPLRQQRVFWKYDLQYGKHTIKISNSGKHSHSHDHCVLDIDAFVVTKGRDYSTRLKPAKGDELAKPKTFMAAPDNLSTSSASQEQWNMVEKGSTGVNAMQITVISPSHALIVDKVEHNPLTVDGHPAWAALYNLETHEVKALSLQSNSFCAGGSFLGNGTLINVGGNPVVKSFTAAADFGDLDGLQAIRVFEPCDSDNVVRCQMYENHDRIRMASPRWYNTVVRIPDGSAMIIGGSKRGGWINNSTVNNPTIEFYPPKSIHGSKGMPIHLDFFVDTLSSNLFPIAFVLPDGKMFMAANNDAMIYDWKTNKERRLPRIPNGVRVTYPMSGTGVLLPLSPDNDYVPEVLLCGGSAIPDDKPSYEISSKDKASSQCSRIVLSDEDIKRGWQVEQMPQERTMADAVLLPTGKLLIVNGAGSGISGYGNVRDQVGASNADHPVFSPVLYDPAAPKGSRFTISGMPTSQIPRLYHSVATLTPNGDVMVAGSNPNLDRSEVKYGTEYRVEWIQPPYTTRKRPEIKTGVKKLGFGQKVNLPVSLASASSKEVKVALMDLGYVTHAVHANSRLVWLKTEVGKDSVSIEGPPNENIYPPGPGWLYVVEDGMPSKGIKVMVGEGHSPKVDQEALENLLNSSKVDQYDKSKSKGSSEE